MREQDPETGYIMPHEPTEKTRAEVSALYSFGIPQPDIAKFIGIDDKTLRKHYRHELDSSVTKANAAVGRFLYQSATGQSLKDGATHSDCVRAAMFWAKTRMGWRETNNLDVTSGGESITRVERIIIDSTTDTDA